MHACHFKKVSGMKWFYAIPSETAPRFSSLLPNDCQMGEYELEFRYGKTVALRLNFPENFSSQSIPDEIWIWVYPGQFWTLALLVDALRSTFSTTVLIRVMLSYPDYSRWVESDNVKIGLSGRVYARLLSSLCVDEWFLLDVHHSHLLEYFSSPVRMISTLPFWADFIRSLGDIDLLVAPDCGREESIKTLAQKLSLESIVIDKYSAKPLARTAAEKVQGKNVFVFDDEIRSGNTLQLAAKILTENGAQKIHFGVLYPLCKPMVLKCLKAQERVKNITISDVLPFPQVSEVGELALVKPVLENLLSH